MAVKPVPDCFNTISAYLIVPDPKEAMELYARAFGAEPGTTMMMPGSDEVVMHAEMRIGDSTFMLTHENPEWQARSAKTLGGSPISLHLYVEDADAVFQRAVDAGCQVVAPMMDAFWGDRFGKVMDPFGLQWAVATHVKDLTEEEMARGAAEWFASMGEKDQG